MYRYKMIAKEHWFLISVSVLALLMVWLYVDTYIWLMKAILAID